MSGFHSSAAIASLAAQAGGDVFDIVLNGRTAIVESIEQDFDDRMHVAVVDRRRSGWIWRSAPTGHRFFFTAEEVELLS